jgi:hypothetical protein
MDRTARNDEITGQLRRLANRQLGLVSRRQVLDAGATTRWIAWRVTSGEWERVEAGFYLLPGRARTWDVDALVACLSRGQSARLAYSSAAKVFGLKEGQPTGGHIEVLVPHGQRCRSTPGVTVHRTRRLVSSDTAKYGVLPVTTVARTIADLAGRLDDSTVERLVDDALIRCLTTVPLLDSCLNRNGDHGRRGCNRVRAALELWSCGGMQSHAEVVVARWLRRSGFPAPVAQMPVIGPSGQRWFVDFAWPPFRVVLEVDGFEHHHGPRKLSRDHERKSGIEAAGWRVLTATVAEIERGGELLTAALKRLLR